MEGARQEEKEKIEEELTWLYLYRIEQGKDNNFDGQLVVENIADLERVINGRLLTYEQAKEQEQLIQEKLDDPNRDRMETATLYRLQQGLREYARWIATSDQLQAEEQTMTARFNEISQEREQAAKSEMEPDVYFGLMQQLEGEQLDIWGQTPGIRERRYNVAMQEDFAEMGQELVERIMQIPYWEQDAEQQEKVSETIEQLRKQGYSDEEIKEYVKYARYRRDEAEVAERKEEQIQFAEEHPVWASILSVPAKLVGAVTGTVQSLIDYVGSIGEEGYQAPNRNGMGYILNDFAQTVRGTVSKEIAEQTDWEIFGVNVASWGYETLLGVADFAAATLAGWGNIGTTLTILATERGTERFLQVLDQGGTMEQAFWSGVTTGALDRILNKLPVEKLLGKSSGKVRQTLWKTMKEQGLLQMGSEAAGRVTDIVADTVVMGEQSEYKRLEAQYLKQGLNGKEARRQALLDLAGSVAVSGGSGLVQGAALGSVAQLARRLFQMGNSGAEIEQEQPVQYIDPEQGSLDDNVRDLYAYYREQAQIDSAAKDGIMETTEESGATQRTGYSPEQIREFAQTNGIQNLSMTYEEIYGFCAGRQELAEKLILSIPESYEDQGLTLTERVRKQNLPETPGEGSLSAYQTRVWYKWQQSMIESRLDRSQPLEQQAKQAFEMRNGIRTQARKAMQDTAWAQHLFVNQRNITFSELIDKYQKRGLFGDHLWQEIIRAAMRSRDKIDGLFQLQ